MIQIFYSSVFTPEKWNICLHKHLRMTVKNSFIYKTLQMEITQMSIHYWKNKQVLIQPYNGILFGNRRE